MQIHHLHLGIFFLSFYCNHIYIKPTCLGLLCHSGGQVKLRVHTAWGFRKCFLCPPKAIKFTKPLTSPWECKVLACLRDPCTVPVNWTPEVTLLCCTNRRMPSFQAIPEDPGTRDYISLSSFLFSDCTQNMNEDFHSVWSFYFFLFFKRKVPDPLWPKMMKWALTGGDHRRKGLETHDGNQKQAMCYFTIAGGLIHDTAPLDDNGGGLFHSSVCVTPMLHFATSWNPKACQGKRDLLCTHVCGAWQTGPLQGAPAALLCRCY